MSVDSGSGEDLTGLAQELEDTFDELRGVPLDDWATVTIVSTMFPLLAGLAILQMISGSVLEAYEEMLLAYPSLLILVPVQIGTAGNLGSILCSRLSTQLHLGTFEPTIRAPAVRDNAFAILALAVTVFTVVGVAAWALGTALGGSAALASVLVISLASGMLLAGVVLVLSFTLVPLSYRLGYNPDDTTIPLVTNVSDIVGVLLLFAIATTVL